MPAIISARSGGGIRWKTAGRWVFRQIMWTTATAALTSMASVS